MHTSYSHGLRSLTVSALIVFLVGASGAAQDRALTLDARLLTAVSHGQIEKVKSLLAAGANPNSRGKDGMTPLMFASQPKRTPIGKMDGAYTVTAKGRPELVKLLLSRGAKLEATDKHGRTALIIAASEGMLEVARVLVNSGANVNAKDQVLKATPLLWASINKYTPMIKFLMEKGADVNARNGGGVSLLLIAASLRNDPPE